MGMHDDGKFHVKCLCTIKPRSCHWLCPALSSLFDVCEHTSCIFLQLRFFQHYLYSGAVHITFLVERGGGGGVGHSWHSIVGLGTRQLFEQFKRYFIFCSPKPPA